MNTISFSRENGMFVSQPFTGGIMMQISVDATRPIRVALETRIDPLANWCPCQSLMIDASSVLAIKDYAADQLFRLRATTPITAVASALVSNVDGSALENLSEYNILCASK